MLAWEHLMVCVWYIYMLQIVLIENIGGINYGHGSFLFKYSRPQIFPCNVYLICLYCHGTSSFISPVKEFRIEDSVPLVRWGYTHHLFYEQCDRELANDLFLYCLMDENLLVLCSHWLGICMLSMECLVSFFGFGVLGTRWQRRIWLAPLFLGIWN